MFEVLTNVFIQQITLLGQDEMVEFEEPQEEVNGLSVSLLGCWLYRQVTKCT